jgi:hypothetical protein
MKSGENILTFDIRRPSHQVGGCSEACTAQEDHTSLKQQVAARYESTKSGLSVTVNTQILSLCTALGRSKQCTRNIAKASHDEIGLRALQLQAATVTLAL